MTFARCLTLPILATLLLSGCRPDPSGPAPKVSSRVLFLDSNSQPLTSTAAADTVDIAVELKNESPFPAHDLSLMVGGSWLIAPSGKPGDGQWTSPALVPGANAPALAPQETKTVRFPVELRRKITDLQPKNWPYRLKAEAVVKFGPAMVSRSSGELPITPAP